MHRVRERLDALDLDGHGVARAGNRGGPPVYPTPAGVPEIEL